MSKEILFWLALGVVMIDGDEYGAGMPLPVDKIGKEQLKQWKKSEKVGVVVSVSPETAVCKQCLALESKLLLAKKGLESIPGLKENLSEAKEGLKLLPVLEGELKAAEESLEGLPDLESKLKAAEDDIIEKAALIKSLKADVKKLAPKGDK